MAASITEDLVDVLDHVAYKNMRSVSAWQERLWQNHLRKSFVDPRDEGGRRLFRELVGKVDDLHPVAQNLFQKRLKVIAEKIRSKG